MKVRAMMRRTMLKFDLLVAFKNVVEQITQCFFNFKIDICNLSF